MNSIRKKINKYGLPPGFTAYICFGKYSGFKINYNKFAIQIILGIVSIAFMKFDIEQFIEQEFAEKKQLREKVQLYESNTNEKH